MGAPAFTVFCKKGHICHTNGHHELSDPPEKCFCGETELATETEWGDEDYGPFSVPYEPLESEYIINEDDFGTKYKTKIDIYYVDRLFEKNKQRKNISDLFMIVSDINEITEGFQSIIIPRETWDKITKLIYELS